MQEIVFTEKNCKTSFGLSDLNYNFPLRKPMLCPHCGAYQDGILSTRTLFEKQDNYRFGVISYKCTHCAKFYLVTYRIDLSAKIAEFVGFYPTQTVTYENAVLQEYFPRFIDSYNQALRAELRGDIELSAVGYRQALECLIKDYAIQELGMDRADVSNKKLVKAIAEYLGESDLAATADVVRILGNDYAHYERRYPEHDFALLKRYMEIFVKLVETKLLIAHPPVSR